MKLSINYNHLQAEKNSNLDINRNSTVEYPMDLYIQNMEQIGENHVIIPFSLKTSTQPEIANFTITGELFVEGTPDEVLAFIEPIGKDPPKVWRKIYQESVNLLTVLAKVIEVPFPAPKMGGITVDY